MAKEVFLLVNDEYTGVATEVCEFEELSDLNTQLETDSYGDLDAELKVFHGVIVPAKFLPDDLDSIKPFVYIPNPLGKTNIAAANEAHFERVSGGADGIAFLVQELLQEESFKFDNGNEPVTIDNVFLFFGHRLQKVLHVPETHIDEEIIERVSELADSVMKHTKQLEEGNYET